MTHVARKHIRKKKCIVKKKNINGAPVTGTVYGSGAGTQQNNGQAIIALAASDVLTLRNHSSSATVTLQTLAGGTQTYVNASVVIKKLK